MADTSSKGDGGGPPDDRSSLQVEAQLAIGQAALDAGDIDGALESFRAAARAGDARAVNMLGRVHELRRDGLSDLALAAQHYRRAAELGDASAMFNLADLYGRGRGVPRDDPAAYALYTEAARRGHAKSLNMLGMFHEEGRHVPPDAPGARAFYAAGARQGDCWAGFNLGRLLLAEGCVDEAAAQFSASLTMGFGDYWSVLAAELSAQPDPRLAAIGRQAEALARAGMDGPKRRPGRG